ncbi:MAG: hypothetical protein RL632_34 [Bacteroidota bacterium]|jgi:hypothetical protein
MITLSEKQVKFIHDDLERNGIISEELRWSLVDHICCVIEEEMSMDDTFEDFYASIIPRFFTRELKEIQEETNLLLTFKHYYAMKNVMIRSGAFTAICFSAGFLFKIMHWPGAAFLILTSIVVFSFLFLPILFLFKTREVNLRSQKSLIGIATVFGFLFSMSTLFKLMHWPYANVLWLSSLGILLLVFLPLYFFTGIRTAETKINTIISSILILVAGGMLFALTALYNTKWADESQMLSNRRVMQTLAFAEQVNAKRNTSVHPELVKKCEALINQIDALKMKLIQSLPKEHRNLSETEICRIYGSDLKQADKVLFTNDKQPKKELTNIKVGLNELTVLLKNQNMDAAELFNTADGYRLNDKHAPLSTWEDLNFLSTSFTIVLQNLNMIKLQLRLVELTL